MKQLLRRSKHNTAEREIAREIRRLEELPGVIRVLLGRREGCRHRFRAGRLRIVGAVPGGLKLNAYTDRGVRTVIVLVADDEARERVERATGAPQ
jgi:hypothetical protein